MGEGSIKITKLNSLFIIAKKINFIKNYYIRLLAVNLLSNIKLKILLLINILTVCALIIFYW